MTGPVFILGVGRCGSTYQQRLLSSAGDLWIWGEHDGVLAYLKSILDAVQSDTPLERFSLSLPMLSADALAEFDQGDANSLAWNNGFSREDVISAVHQCIRRLFAERLPEGKLRWGFKEIRYGPENDVPRLLLDLFPDGRIVHAVRDPIDTVVSSVYAWQNEAVFLSSASDFARVQLLRDHIAMYTHRWIESARYFRQLKEYDPTRVYTSRIEDFPGKSGELIAFAEISPKSDHVLTRGRVNENLNKGRVRDVSNHFVEVMQANAHDLDAESEMLGYETLSDGLRRLAAR